MTQSDKTEARRVAEALAKEFAYMARERACADAIHAALIAYGDAVEALVWREAAARMQAGLGDLVETVEKALKEKTSP
jgi:hypothetical protein